ncbi:Phosphatidylserine decarboxylase [hydrothermal vent metagenome]|uniref:phosphatidylserine decarboxylase n=1 Tax=hydrothermal vent metagenome TaxID=652676 RepID=A0A3B0ZLW1_9ZZZZ
MRYLNHISILLQYILPHHFLTWCVRGITRIRFVPFKNVVIKLFIRAFKVDMSIALEENPSAYPDFNSFFTRPLKPDARPLSSAPGEIACPVDGAISQLGEITNEGRIFQAKGHDYSLEELLGGSKEMATLFEQGSFATIYLSPKDYHRIHMPLQGELQEMVYIPGRLFSVSKFASEQVPRLFARNERLVSLFETEIGPMAMIMVGALNVAGMETVWAGNIPDKVNWEIKKWNYRDSIPEKTIKLAHGAEMGRFNMGSTVILLYANNRIKWNESITAECPVKMGQHLASTLQNN